MVDAHPAPRIPTGILVGAGLLLALTVALAGVARRNAAGHPQPRPVPVESADVRFEDRSDGSIAMLDAASGRMLAAVPPASDGFVRGVLRGLSRERKLESMGRMGAFRLSRERTGHVVLEDLATGRRVELGAFGSTNEAAFARLLAAAKEGTR